MLVQPYMHFFCMFYIMDPISYAAIKVSSPQSYRLGTQCYIYICGMYRTLATQSESKP